MRKQNLLVVDDEKGVVNALNRQFKKEYMVYTAANGKEALVVLKEQQIAVIIADQRMPGMTGVDFLEIARSQSPNSMRILITAYADIEASIDAVNKSGIFYYVAKPWEPDELNLIVKRAVDQYELQMDNRRLLKELEEANDRLSDENRMLKTSIEKQADFSNIISRNPQMHKIFKLASKVMDTDTTVLIQGETGTGKELLARAIHYNGNRREKLFVTQNCAALTNTLLESELFGHVKGAFTGAVYNKKGLFEIAHGGTILLDEIGDTTPEFQVRLLRVLQEGEIKPVGSESSRKIDVRVIAATNKDLEMAVREGSFREDLFYRLSVFPILIPPLRERKEDIPLLAEHFMAEYGKKIGKRINGIHTEVMSQLQDYAFPGNIRELQNRMERAVILAEDGTEIGFEEIGHITSDVSVSPQDSLNLKDKIEVLEKELITKVLEKTNGNRSRAAEILGISRQGLYQKIENWGL